MKLNRFLVQLAKSYLFLVDSAASEPVYINGYLIGGEFANGRFATVYLGTRNHENFAMKALQLNQVKPPLPPSSPFPYHPDNICI